MWRSVLFSHNTFDGFDHQIRSLDLNEAGCLRPFSFRLFRERRANSVCCFGSPSITFSRVRTTRGKPASESGVSDAWCKMVYAERHDSIIAGPLLNSRVSKNVRSSQTGIVGTGSGSLLSRGGHVGREWRLL